jgi:hypothetical protein
VDVDDLKWLAASCDESAFRLEARPTYRVPNEEDEFAAWQRGERTLRVVEADPWLQHIRESTARGVHWSRVRVVDRPLNSYSQFELYGLQANVRAGEEVLVADRAWAGELSGLGDDFWLFDGAIAVRMRYGGEGCFVGAERAPEVVPYVKTRLLALAHAVPLADFLVDHEPRLIA